jgi:hypothetical protein
MPGAPNSPVGQPVAACKVLHWISVRIIKQPYLKPKPNWWISPPETPYPSEQFAGEITAGHKDAETDGKGSAVYLDIPSGKCSVKFKSFYLDIEKALHPHGFTNAQGLFDAPVPAAAGAPNFSVDLIVEKNLLTLKHDHKCKLEVKVTPPGLAVDEYRIEIKRASGGSWCTLSSTATLDPWFARIAGKLKLRGVAKIGGTEHQSGEKDVEGRFPDYNQIVADSAVQTEMSAAWCNTLNDCTANPNRRREYAFWILLNTLSDAYEFGPVVTGPWCAPADGAGANPGTRPPDKPATPAPCDQGATYSVGLFHTHTPTEFRAGGVPPGSTRPIGPSPPDESFHTANDVPGAIYDFVDSPAGSNSIPVGHPKNSPAKLYPTAGQTRRTTPK